ncbi:MAG: hypothetical protein LLG00_01450 [Planctomycetaceae bacterium]|nr:hypothetical protein [Planctomycetaceae bacterium]
MPQAFFAGTGAGGVWLGAAFGATGEQQGAAGVQTFGPQVAGAHGFGQQVETQHRSRRQRFL